MTDELLKKHAIGVFRQLSHYISEDSIFSLEEELREYQIKNKHLHEFKYQDVVERDVLTTYLLKNDIIVFKEVEQYSNKRLFILSEKGKALLRKNKELTR